MSSEILVNLNAGIPGTLRDDGYADSFVEQNNTPPESSQTGIIEHDEVDLVLYSTSYLLASGLVTGPKQGAPQDNFFFYFHHWLNNEIPFMYRDKLAALIGRAPIHFRKRFSDIFGMALIEDDLINWIRGFGPSIELGAGTGYLTRALRNKGHDVIGCDPVLREPLYSPIEARDGPLFLCEHDDDNRTVIMSWPDYGADWPEDVLRCVKSGTKLIYIGEGRGGACATDYFFDQLDEDFDQIGKDYPLLQWNGINDVARAYIAK